MDVRLAEVPLWERPGLRRATGETLRPGGFQLTDRAAESAGIAPGWLVLDVGCGLGATVKRLRSRYGAKAVGMDLSDRQLAEFSGTGTMVRAGGVELPFASDIFQAIFCECVFSLLPDPAAALREFRRVLVPGGFLCLSDLYGHGDRAAKKGKSCAENALGHQEVIAMIENHGFGVRLFEDHSGLLKDLAARLILSGEIRDVAHGCGGDIAGLGYFLVVARKEEADSC